MRIDVYNIKEDIVKRRILVNKFKDAGWKLWRHGGKHDIYVKDGMLEEIPRHPDINENLAKALIKKWNL